MRLAATNEGITLVPEMAVDTKANPDLRFIPFSKPKPRRELGILWRVTTPLAPKHRLLIKVLEEINKRDLYELDSYQRKAEEVGYVESCADAVDSSPNLTSVPQGAETLPYLNREAKS